MIKDHRDILNLWPSTSALVKRISEEYPNLSKRELKLIGGVLRSSKDRGKLTQPYWKYLIRVGAEDYEGKKVKVLVTANLLERTSDA